MTAIAVTGAHGFLGWHTRVRARALLGETPAALRLGEGYDPDEARTTVDGAEHVIHVAGVNRGTDDEVRDGNLAAADRLVDALRGAASRPGAVTYAGSTQSDTGTHYGVAKAEAGERIAAACEELGIRFRELRLPNLFGEHGRPYYNSVVATFCERAARGEELTVVDDKELLLLHAQAAAAQLLDVEGGTVVAGAVPVLVSRVKELVERFSTTYRTGDIPVLATDFERDLFNTYRSFTFPDPGPHTLVKRVDPRGSLTETVRVHGGEGQTFFSVTVPGITRGQHHHLRKIERFVVLAGEAEISLRRVLTDEVHRFRVSGDEPVAIDMPTMWVHNITNVGTEPLYTQFWASELFNPEDPDTHPEEV